MHVPLTEQFLHCQGNLDPAAECCLANAQLILEDRAMTGAAHLCGGRIAGISEGDQVPVSITTVFDALRVGSVEGDTVNSRKYARNVADGIP